MKDRDVFYFPKAAILLGTLLSCFIGWTWLHFFNRTSGERLWVGSMFFMLALLWWFFKRPLGETRQSPFLWSLCFPAIFPIVIPFVVRIGSLHNSFSIVLSAAATGVFEETLFRIIPLLVFYTDRKRLRQIVMLSSSILFGLAHVIGYLDQLHVNALFLSQFFSKVVSTGAFGFCLAILIVNYKFLGSLAAIFVHVLYDWMAYAMSSAVKVSYISTNAKTAGINAVNYCGIAVVTIFLIWCIYHAYNKRKASFKSTQSTSHLSFWGFTKD